LISTCLTALSAEKANPTMKRSDEKMIAALYLVI
jgi:hypothetical protein